MKALIRLALCCVMGSAMLQVAAAQSVKPRPPSPPAASVPVAPARATPAASAEDDEWRMPDRVKVNDNTVTVITAPVGGIMAMLGSDMSRVLDDDANLRVISMIGKGPVQNIADILYLKNVDMGMTLSDVPEFYKLQYNVPDIQTRLRYIAKLYNGEIHIVAPTSIKTIFDLEGKTVVAPKDIGFATARAIFSRLGIKAKIDYRTDGFLGLQQVVDGKVDAWFTATGKINQNVRAVKNSEGKLHFVSIPYDRRIQDLYLPTEFTNEDYPNLVAPNEPVDTVANMAILASVNWPETSDRYKRVARFVDVFFQKMDEFHKPPRNPKWREASIVTTVPGWIRFKAAQEWLDSHRPSAASADAARPADPSTREFEQYLTQQNRSGQKLSPEEMVKVYSGFLEWRRNR
jgi:TRAP-type uncharacterized transport system substrate-binding protein